MTKGCDDVDRVPSSNLKQNESKRDVDIASPVRVIFIKILGCRYFGAYVFVSIRRILLISFSV